MVCAAALVLTGTGFAAAPARDPALVGPWRATNDCFLSAFNLLADGHVETVYLNGERDGRAHWDSEDDTLTITSDLFPQDSFEGEVTGDNIEADYVWHDIDRDEYNPQECSFQRFIPGAGT